MTSNQPRRGNPGVALPWLSIPVMVCAPLGWSQATRQGSSEETSTHELVLHLNKLDEQQVEAVSKALESLSRAVYLCPMCSLAQPGAGECPACEVELELDGEPVYPVQGVEADPDAATVRLFLTPGATLNLSEIERALKGKNVKAKRDDLAILAWSRLALNTKADEADEDSLRSVLETLSLEIAELEIDAESASAAVFIGALEGDTIVTVGQVSKALKKAESPFVLVDLAWSGPCKGCSGAGATVAACRRCWTPTTREASSGG